MALQLFKLYNMDIPNDDWTVLNFQQNFNMRNNFVKIMDFSNLRVGKNCLINKMNCINNRINFDWLNLSFESLKSSVKIQC